MHIFVCHIITGTDCICIFGHYYHVLKVHVLLVLLQGTEGTFITLLSGTEGTFISGTIIVCTESTFMCGIFTVPRVYISYLWYLYSVYSVHLFYGIIIHTKCRLVSGIFTMYIVYIYLG